MFSLRESMRFVLCYYYTEWHFLSKALASCVFIFEHQHEEEREDQILQTIEFLCLDFV